MMVRPFLAANRPRRAELLQILERDFSAFQTVISPEQAKSDPEWVDRSHSNAR